MSLQPGDVALKVLPEGFTSDPDRPARFEREAKVLAAEPSEHREGALLLSDRLVNLFG